MSDYVQNLDAAALLTVEAGLSLCIAPFSSPPYNFPLFLFGIYAQERPEPTDSFKLFTGMLGISAVLDFIWLFTNSQNGFIKTISILILILKVPTFFATLRGAGSIGFPRGEGTVWSMPGGFSGSDNQATYQRLGGDVETGRPAPTARSVPPSQPAAAPMQQPAVSSTYQSM